MVELVYFYGFIVAIGYLTLGVRCAMALTNYSEHAEFSIFTILNERDPCKIIYLMLALTSVGASVLGLTIASSVINMPALPSIEVITLLSFFGDTFKILSGFFLIRLAKVRLGCC